MVRDDRDPANGRIGSVSARLQERGPVHALGYGFQPGANIQPHCSPVLDLQPPGLGYLAGRYDQALRADQHAETPGLRDRPCPSRGRASHSGHGDGNGQDPAE